MKLSKNGLELIKSFEGLRLKAYKVTDSEKYFTIGYGHYGSDVKEGMEISKKKAEELFEKDVQRFVDGVNELVKVPINQNQFDALVSFAYNVGLGALKKSTLLDLLNGKEYKGASEQFERWNKSGGKVLKGLVTRREKEQKLFDTSVKEKPAVAPTGTTSSKPKGKDSIVKESVKKTEYIKYRIKMGDTLTGISKKFNVPIHEIASINRIANIHRIYTGHILKIPKR
jgi:GH24 family phage-related lysozyme (muramidase)